MSRFLYGARPEHDCRYPLVASLSEISGKLIQRLRAGVGQEVAQVIHTGATDRGYQLRRKLAKAAPQYGESRLTQPLRHTLRHTLLCCLAHPLLIQW